ncbi:sugar phosphate isomerase/epimerase family protein [Celeribacter neptunius]|uniref:Sugar phosphate isomerase/epimerase n=1 Tax=Celeribacter neptunius TaxID=588602 RepID=A0A1I3QXU0_9RHOB|nr:sugar phosphate isomerase/epimerase family protein [Celeribacter neptunius]SFJ38984.1 Sugar phosphate isomerase/epimerase [Celeribacter neptunius]
MTLPVIGAALMVEDLPQFRDWLIEKDRDLEIQSFFWPELLISGDWQGLVEEAKKQLDGHNGRLGIHGPFWGLSLSNPDPEIRAIVAKRMMQGLDVAEALGARFMVIHSPYTTWDWHNLDLHAGARGRVIELVHDSLRDVVKRAENMGLTLMLENIEDIDPEDRKILARSFDSEAIKLSVDTGHAHYAHGATGARPVDVFIRSAGEMLGHVHLQDADGFADRHWAIGEGTVRWHEVFRALDQIEADPHLILELRSVSGIMPSMDWLTREGLGQ